MATDAFIVEKVDGALWNTGMLRSTDYREIDVVVKDGVVFLSGHVISSSNQRQAEAVARAVPGVKGVKNSLVADDTIVREVATALGEIERVYGGKFFTGARNGVVVLTGQVGSATTRKLAEKRAAQILDVRGVINTVQAPGVDTEAEDQRFMQPTIGEPIYFKDNLIVKVHCVIINPNNRRVIAMVARGRFSKPQEASRFSPYGNGQLSEKLVVIPMSAIRYLTTSSGFLTIDSTETAKYIDFEPSSFAAPNEDWTPPYPYRRSDVLFPVGSLAGMEQTEAVTLSGAV